MVDQKEEILVYVDREEMNLRDYQTQSRLQSGDRHLVCTDHWCFVAGKGVRQVLKMTVLRLMMKTRAAILLRSLLG